MVKLDLLRRVRKVVRTGHCRGAKNRGNKTRVGFEYSKSKTLKNTKFCRMKLLHFVGYIPVKNHISTLHIRYKILRTDKAKQPDLTDRFTDR